MVISSCNAYLNGTPGAKHHLGYGMLARSTFGLWGSYFGKVESDPGRYYRNMLILKIL
jgi:cytosine/uracil/thiamine/allantoin permease